MKIEFYEEFPSKDVFDKLKLIKFETKIFVAAKSVEDFKKYEKEARKIDKKVKCAYWPIVKNSYWISPFSSRQDLIDLFKELNNCNNDLLIDLELPLNKKMILRNLFSYFGNRRLIKNFLDENRSRIMTAQFPSSIISVFMKIVGLNYDVDLEKSFMWYSSMNSNIVNRSIKKKLLKLKNKKKHFVGLGTIATGILGNEPILSSENLEKDLDFVRKAGFERVVIFRLGGLNKKYVDVLNKFID